eukprot:1186011-Prorocentrum_minimum.AAC.1
MGAMFARRDGARGDAARTRARGIFSLPFCDLCLPRVYSFSPYVIGACYGRSTRERVGATLAGVGPPQAASRGRCG